MRLADRLLQRERADLRAVAVREHDLVARPSRATARAASSALAVCSGQVPRSSSRIRALPPNATTRRPWQLRASYALRMASQIARAGRSVGLRQEWGWAVRKWIESPARSS